MILRTNQAHRSASYSRQRIDHPHPEGLTTRLVPVEVDFRQQIFDVCSSLNNGRSPKGRLRQLWPSRPGEFHPEPLTDPDLTLSRHPARATARRLPPSVEN